MTATDGAPVSGGAVNRIRPFRIGGITVDFPAVLAAIAGYTDLPYRAICRELGAPYCATEMLLDKSVLVGGKLRRRLVQIGPGDHPVAAQLIGNESETMAKAASLLAASGFDVIDLNFACPVRKALARHRGGFMMRQPQDVLAIVRGVVGAMDLPVTLKLRRSFHQADSTNDDFWRIAEGAFDAGVAAICVHARSVEMKYTGPADWSFLAEVKRRFPEKTVIGSGDVLRPIDALRMLEQTGVDAAAVARGGLGNPWFFRQVRDLAAGRAPYQPLLSEQRALLERHMRDVCELFGPVRGPKMMRKFGIKYARMHPHPREVRIAFVAVRSPQQWYEVLQQHYSE